MWLPFWCAVVIFAFCPLILGGIWIITISKALPLGTISNAEIDSKACDVYSMSAKGSTWDQPLFYNWLKIPRQHKHTTNQPTRNKPQTDHNTEHKPTTNPSQATTVARRPPPVTHLTIWGCLGVRPVGAALAMVCVWLVVGLWSLCGRFVVGVVVSGTPLL
jgi:hypothetical protein